MGKDNQETSGFSSAFFTYASNLKSQLRQVRLAAKDSMRDVRETVDRTKEQLHRDFPGLGSKPDQNSGVIDVGRKRHLGIRLVQGGAGIVVIGLMIGGAASIALFALQIALAFFIAVHILGIRIDLNPLHQNSPGG